MEVTAEEVSAVDGTVEVRRRLQRNKTLVGLGF